jgi:hypothetical protein
MTKFDFENHARWVAVVGSRDFKKPKWVKTFLSRLKDGTVIVSGGAKRGVDLWVKEYCLAHKERVHYKEIPVEDFEWDIDKGIAGPDRNEVLLFLMSVKQRRYPTHTVIFANIDEGVITPGSKSVVSIAQKMGLPHTLYTTPV